MHCNLNVARVAADITGFHHKAHSALAYVTIQHFGDPLWIQRPLFTIWYGKFGDWLAFTM